jgi:hypothetical protein
MLFSQWSLKFIAVAFVLPSLIFVNVVIYCCCTNKKCIFHEQFLDARRVLCPWWKIDEVQKWASSLGADNFVVAQDSEPDVEMMPVLHSFFSYLVPLNHILSFLSLPDAGD